MDEFTRRNLKHYIARLAVNGNDNQTRTMPVETISEAALDIFVDAVLYRMKCISKEAIRTAQHAGRTDVNIQDIFDALWSYREDVITLAESIQQMSMDVNIEPYPIRPTTTQDTRFNDSIGDIPYRADAIVEFHGLNTTWLPPQNPQFFPPFSDSNFLDPTENDQDFHDPSLFLESDVTKQDNIQKYLNCPLVESILQSLKIPDFDESK